MMARCRRRAGRAALEFTLVGVPLIFFLMSIFEISRGIWIYHTLAHAAKEGARYVCVKGVNCPTPPNACSVSVGTIAEELNVAFSTATASATGTSITCTPLSSCLGNATVFPPSGENTPGLNDVIVDARYPCRSAIALFWPGSRGVGPLPAITFRSRSRAQIEFGDAPQLALRKQASRGQAIVMVTLALFAMCGLMGLAVDLGWSYFAKKSALSAADAAALAAAEQALANVGHVGPCACGSRAVCQTTAPCPATPSSPPSNNIGNGCLMAKGNGFCTSGSNGRQNVTIAANTTSPPHTVPEVNVQYWVTVRVTEHVPQLLSAIMGNTMATVSSRATAAVV